MLLILDNRVNKADLLVLIIENGIVISEEVETEDPVSLGWSVHEFDNALVSLFGKPLISWDFVNFIVTIEFKVDIWYSSMLFISTLARCESVGHDFTLHFAKESILDCVEVFIWEHIK